MHYVFEEPLYNGGSLSAIYLESNHQSCLLYYISTNTVPIRTKWCMLFCDGHDLFDAQDQASSMPHYWKVSTLMPQHECGMIDSSVPEALFRYLMSMVSRQKSIETMLVIIRTVTRRHKRSRGKRRMGDHRMESR